MYALQPNAGLSGEGCGKDHKEHGPEEQKDIWEHRKDRRPIGIINFFPERTKSRDLYDTFVVKIKRARHDSEDNNGKEKLTTDEPKTPDGQYQNEDHKEESQP